MKLVDRNGWGARPFRQPNGAITYAGPRKGVKVHYLGGAYSDRAHSQCGAYIRSIQNMHMDSNGWSDVGYSFFVCTHGHVFEGRGLRRRNSANGNTSLNEAHYAVCALVGTSGVVEPTTAQLHGLRDAIEYCRTSGPAGNEILGHKDGFATQCPGDALYAWVHQGAPRPGAQGGTYTVKSGDTLWGISQAHGVTVAALKSANGLTSDTISVGQKLTIPGGSTSHTVKSGESLSVIASNYSGVSWQQIADANGISAPYTIQPGQVLTIPVSGSSPTPSPYKAPPFPNGLGPNKASPSARPWQRTLKALGHMPSSVTESDNYGPATQDATARFHNANPQFKSIGMSRDVAVGPKGWEFAHQRAYGGQ